MRGNSKANLIIAIIFCLSLCLPIIWQTLPILNISPKIEEKRKLAEWPSFNLNNVSNYPEQFELFFNDHFGFRNSLIHLNNFVRLKFFNCSGSPKVLVGKDGWLFYNGDKAGDGAPIANHLGLLPFGYNEIFQAYKNDLEAKKAYLARRGIRYVFVIAPDKLSVYPEYLPKGFTNTDRKTNVDLLVEYLKTNANVDIIDLRKVLVDLKRQNQPLFYKSDTHWNDLGAYFAYYNIIKYLSNHFQKISPRSISDFQIEKKTSAKLGDLGKMLSLNNYEDIDYKLIPYKPYFYVHITKGKDIKEIHSYERVGTDLPKALVYRDSFLQPIIPYLSDDFSLITYIWSTWKRGTNIDPWLWKIRPDVVIEERAERYLIPGVDLNIF